MSDGWHPISDDGERMVTAAPMGYSLYAVHGSIDPTASTRRFHWSGFVPEFAHAEQWLKDGQIIGEIVEVPVTPKPVKVKSGAA
jgi:hypothetical protein